MMHEDAYFCFGSRQQDINLVGPDDFEDCRQIVWLSSPWNDVSVLHLIEPIGIGISVTANDFVPITEKQEGMKDLMADGSTANAGDENCRLLTHCCFQT